MKKITITTEVINAIAYDEIVKNHIKKAEREIRKQRIAELIAEGVDKEVAKVMASVGL